MKYRTSRSEDEILPNKLGLSSSVEVAEEEYRGFLRAVIKFESELDHITAFGPIYKFAGNLRTVNMSKGGFTFPTAKFLPEIIQEFKKDFLSEAPKQISNYEELIQFIVPIHAELLFIHPFREGNGRTIRLYSDLMAQKMGFGKFNFDEITDEHMPEYIRAVQSAAEKNDIPIIELFRKLKG